MTLQQKMAEIVHLNTILTKDRRRIESLSITDPLTKLYNRQKLNDVLEMMLLRRHWNEENSFGMIITDVDYFKKVNDTYGHQVGDKVLIAVANILSQTIRTGDILARWGGEEFVVLVSDVDKEKICFVAEKLRTAIEQMNIPDMGTITASFGVSLFVEGDTDETLMYRSDLALYRAKKNGRNRVEFS
jgi:diguanylate cyclase (GGDEF)-like protein